MTKPQLTPEAWQRAVTKLGAAGVSEALASPGAEAVANAPFDFADPYSGMADDRNAWVCRPAIVYAVSNGDVELLKVLLAHAHIDPNGAGADDGVTALQRCCCRTTRAAADGGLCSAPYDPRFLMELLKHPRIDVNRRDIEGTTGLTAAAWYGNAVSAAILLRRPELKIHAPETRPNGDVVTALRHCEEFRHRLPLQEDIGKTQDIQHHLVAQLIRNETARRARVTRAVRLSALVRRVRSEQAAPTGATAELLGAGMFVFDPRCPTDIVPKILVYASGAPGGKPSAPRTAKSAPLSLETVTSPRRRQRAAAATEMQEHAAAIGKLVYGIEAPCAAVARRCRLQARCVPAAESAGALSALPPRVPPARTLSPGELAALPRESLELLLAQERNREAQLSAEARWCADQQAMLDQSVRMCGAVRRMNAVAGAPRDLSAAALWDVAQGAGGEGSGSGSGHTACTAPPGSPRTWSHVTAVVPAKFSTDACAVDDGRPLAADDSNAGLPRALVAEMIIVGQALDAEVGAKVCALTGMFES